MGGYGVARGVLGFGEGFLKAKQQAAENIMTGRKMSLEESRHGGQPIDVDGKTYRTVGSDNLHTFVLGGGQPKVDEKTGQTYGAGYGKPPQYQLQQNKIDMTYKLGEMRERMKPIMQQIKSASGNRDRLQQTIINNKTRVMQMYMPDEWERLNYMDNPAALMQAEMDAQAKADAWEEMQLQKYGLKKSVPQQNPIQNPGGRPDPSQFDTDNNGGWLTPS